MSNKKEKNVKGKWYCTDPDDSEGEGCISCGLCYDEVTSISVFIM